MKNYRLMGTVTTFQVQPAKVIDGNRLSSVSLFLLSMGEERVLLCREAG